MSKDKLGAAPLPAESPQPEPSSQRRLEFIREAIEEALSDGPRASTKHRLQRALRAVRIEIVSRLAVSPVLTETRNEEENDVSRLPERRLPEGQQHADSATGDK